MKSTTWRVALVRLSIAALVAAIVDLSAVTAASEPAGADLAALSTTEARFLFNVDRPASMTFVTPGQIRGPGYGATCSRSLCFITLPVALRGSSATNHR